MSMLTSVPRDGAQSCLRCPQGHRANRDACRPPTSHRTRPRVLRPRAPRLQLPPSPCHPSLHLWIVTGCCAQTTCCQQARASHLSCPSNLSTTLWGRRHGSRFIGEITAQRGQATCPRPHSWWVQKVGTPWVGPHPQPASQGLPEASPRVSPWTPPSLPLPGPLLSI